MSIRRNTLYNLAGALAPVAVTLLTLPTYVRVIGTERFGVLSIAWLLLGYFGLFDLGLSQATAQRIAALREAEPRERAETFWTALALNTGFGLLGGLLLWPVAYLFFSRHFQVGDGIRSEMLASLPWLVAAVPIATISGVLAGALQGRERFLALNVRNVVGTVLFQVLPLGAALLVGPRLEWLLPAVVLARLLSLALLCREAKRHVPLVGVPRIKRDLVGPLFRFGGWVTISGLISPLMTALDRFLIGAQVGATGVTHYTVPYNLANRATILPASLASALFPRISAANDGERERLSVEAVRALVVVVTPLITVGLLLIRPFLSWWMNPEFADAAAPTGQVILVGVWANSFARIPYVQLQAQGRPDLVAKSHLAELPLYLALLYVALRHWGIVGAAMAWSARVIADAVLLFWASGGARRVGPALATPALTIGASVIVARNGVALGSLGWLAACALVAFSTAWALRSAPVSLSSAVARITARLKPVNPESGR
jgi:O-antigen/teichoic acid export membrane protein